MWFPRWSPVRVCDCLTHFIMKYWYSCVCFCVVVFLSLSLSLIHSLPHFERWSLYMHFRHSLVSRLKLAAKSVYTLKLLEMSKLNMFDFGRNFSCLLWWFFLSNEIWPPNVHVLFDGEAVKCWRARDTTCRHKAKDERGRERRTHSALFLEMKRKGQC